LRRGYHYLSIREVERHARESAIRIFPLVGGHMHDAGELERGSHHLSIREVERNARESAN